MWPQGPDRPLLTFSRGHVYADLGAYICTWRDCGLKMFHRYETWFTHDLGEHRLPLLLKASDRLEHAKSELGQLMDDLRENPDGEVMESLIQRFCEAFQIPHEISASACLFCDEWVDPLSEERPQTDKKDIRVDPDSYQRHVAGHMEEVALFALSDSHGSKGRDNGAISVEDREGSDSFERSESEGLQATSDLSDIEL